MTEAAVPLEAFRRVERCRGDPGALPGHLDALLWERPQRELRFGWSARCRDRQNASNPPCPEQAAIQSEPLPGTVPDLPAQDNAVHEGVRRHEDGREQVDRFLRPGGKVEASVGASAWLGAEILLPLMRERMDTGLACLV